MSVFWVGIFVKVISLLRKQMLFLKYFSIYSLMMLLMLCILRLIFSFEFPFTKVINSEEILPFIQSFFCTTFIEIVHIKVNLVLILAVIWGIGVVRIIFKDIKTDYYFRQLLNFLPETNNRHLYDILANVSSPRFMRQVKIIVHESIEAPAIFGFVRPIVLLPTIEFSDDELTGIFMHESAHYKYGHGIVKLMAELIRAIFWWNSIFKELSLEVAHVLELHSDKVVCKKINAQLQKKYLISIVKVARNIHFPPSYPVMTYCLVGENNTVKLKQRLAMIQGEYYKSRKKGDFVIIPVILLIFLLSYSIVLQPYSLPTQDDIGEGELITTEWYLVETLDGYDLYNKVNEYVSHIPYIEGNLMNLRIYKRGEDVK